MEVRTNAEHWSHTQKLLQVACAKCKLDSGDILVRTADDTLLLSKRGEFQM